MSGLTPQQTVQIDHFHQQEFESVWWWDSRIAWVVIVVIVGMVLAQGWTRRKP